MPPRIRVANCNSAFKHILPPGTAAPAIRSYNLNVTKRTTMTNSSAVGARGEPALRPTFSGDVVDIEALGSRVSPLLSTNGGRWALVKDGEALERTFKFKTFAKAWDFMTAVSLQCKVKNHHPEWSNVFNTTFIRWTTHNPKGLSAKDVDLAAACDALARDFGEVVEEQPAAAAGGGASCEVKGLADRVVSSAGDCCTPKSAKQ